MPNPSDVTQLAEKIYNTGLRNNWYLVCRATDVGAKPLSLLRLNEKIVLWRDAAGKVCAVEDFCPHRGAPLSHGHVVEQGIACIYHGVVVDPQGVVAAVPPVENCPIVGRRMVKSYPVREAVGAIFLYFSDGVDDTVPEFELPPELTSDEWSGFIYAEDWQCNYMKPLDNRLDPMHAVYLHAVSFTLSFGVKQSVIDLHETPSGFYIERDNQRGVNIDRTEVTVMPGNNIWVQTAIPYPKSAGGNFFYIFSHLTPIDEHRTYLWVMRYQKSSGWRRDMWRFLYKNRLERRHDDVIDQDRAIMEAIPHGQTKRETLIQCDVGLVRLRRMIRRESEAQARRILGADAHQSAAE